MHAATAPFLNPPSSIAQAESFQGLLDAIPSGVPPKNSVIVDMKELTLTLI